MTMEYFQTFRQHAAAGCTGQEADRRNTCRIYIRGLRVQEAGSENGMRKEGPVRKKCKPVFFILCICICMWMLPPGRAAAQNEAIGLLVQKYEDYRESFAGIETLEDIEGSG